MTLKDRLLQMVVDAAVHPILEYQSDSHSFAYRPNRSAIDAIILIVNRLAYLQKQQTSSRYLQSKVLGSINNVIKPKIKKQLNQSILSHFIVKIGIHKCFESIAHDMIVKMYPLCAKYQYFLKAWLKAPIYGLFFEESKNASK